MTKRAEVEDVGMEADVLRLCVGEAVLRKRKKRRDPYMLISLFVMFNQYK